MLTEPFDDALNPADPLAASRIRIVPNVYEEHVLNFVDDASTTNVEEVTTTIDPRDIPFCYADDNNTTPINPSEKWPYSVWVLNQLEANRTRKKYSEAIDAAVAEWQEWKNAGGTGTPVGLYQLGGYTYLRESDKKLTGRITYRTALDDDHSYEDRIAVFELDRAGDFTRDHVWTILVMFEGGQMRFFDIVDLGITSWKMGINEPHEVFNW